MTKSLTVLILSISVTGCFINDNRQRDLSFPVTLEVSNTTEDKFHSGLIYGTPESSGGFNIPVTKIGPKKTTQQKVTGTTYSDIKNELFEFEGTCGKNTNWKSNTTNTKINAIDNTEEWKIELRIINCQ